MYLSKSFLLGLVPSALAKVQYLGVAIAGGDFGCQIDGTCPTSSVQFANDASDQMKHFVSDGLNLMRIPTSWQFLVNNQLDGSLNDDNIAKYDQLIQTCLDTGAYCMIDIHNFARWNGGIIGQGGPSDDQFVKLWTQLATKYVSSEKVVFELMNEPHDLDINIWTQTCQKVVTAIRNAGATTQMILLPGTNFDSAATLISSGSADSLLAITNPDGSTDGLILDIHKYLDEDNSGTHEECVTDNVGAFAELAQFLRQNGRQGLISESGASSDASCFTNFCSQNTFINQNSDVFVGFVAWAAGSFSTSYVLSLTPSKQNGQYIDNNLMTQCVLAPWLNSNSTSRTPTISSQTSIIPTTSAKQASLVVSGTSVPTLPVTGTSDEIISLATATATANASLSLNASTSHICSPRRSLPSVD
ncbi:glycoside hydrolase superfamily [Truncatella angustata]|uniref:Endoglucanase EG-II n=1 Tax=Truncatella angustata TaxID=152316 RepID=A0A9P8ULB0_9PEZI|nr:glycoside hydrolase superfamily [Truncatella angustata]KAH6654075.1 glycoside hydrolase superfamily [Truncatella angustata]